MLTLCLVITRCFKRDDLILSRIAIKCFNNRHVVDYILTCRGNPSHTLPKQCTSKQTCTYTHTPTHTYMHTHSHTNTHIHAHALTHQQTHSEHTCTHTHTTRLHTCTRHAQVHTRSHTTLIDIYLATSCSTHTHNAHTHTRHTSTRDHSPSHACEHLVHRLSVEQIDSVEHLQLLLDAHHRCGNLWSTTQRNMM